MRPVFRITVDAARHGGRRATALWRLATVGGLTAMGALACGVASADDQEAAAVRAIPASVSTVVAGGLWGDHGSYRVVVTQGGFEHIHSEVYAQWLRGGDEDGNPAKVVESVRVRELSDFVGAVIGDVRMASDSRQSNGVVEVDVVDSDTQKTRIARLRMAKPGELSVQLPPQKRVD